MTLLRRLRVPALLFLIVTGYYWRLVLTNQYTWLNSPDYCYQVLPWYQFEASEWHAKRIPLWNPYEFAGQSMIGQGQPGVADPLNLPLFWWPLQKTWMAEGALHWFYILPHFLAALGFYALCRELGRSKIASAFAGSLYTLSGIAASLDWPQMNHATVWGPIALLFQFRVLNGKQPIANGILSGFFLGLAWLAGHHQVPIYFTLASAGFWIYYFFNDSARRSQLARAAVAAIICMFMVGAVQTLPAYEYGHGALRWAGAEEALRWNQPVPYFVHRDFSMSSLSMLSIVMPGFETMYSPFIGWITVLTGLFGALVTWNERSTKWLAALAAAGFFYSLGAHTILQGLFYAFIPMVEKARVPAIAQIIFSTGICALAAAGVDHLEVWSTWRRRLSAAFGIVGAIIIATALTFTLMKIIFPGVEDRWVMSGWIALAVWLALRRTTRHAWVWLGFLALTELSMTTPRLWANMQWKDRARMIDSTTLHSDIATFIRSRPGSPRMRYTTDDIPYSFGDWWGIESIEAMVPSVPEELWKHDVWSRRVDQLLSARYYVGKKPSHPQQTEVFSSQSGLKIFEDPDVLPRVWAVHDVQPVKDLNAAKGLLQDFNFDLRHRSFVIGQPPAVEACLGDGDAVAFETRVPNRLTLQTNLKCRGMVVVNDLYESNWKAEIDGRPAPVYEAYSLVRGVVVDGGRHKLELIYRPHSVYAGAALTGFGFLIAMIAFWRTRR